MAHETVVSKYSEEIGKILNSNKLNNLYFKRLLLHQIYCIKAKVNKEIKGIDLNLYIAKKYLENKRLLLSNSRKEKLYLNSLEYNLNNVNKDDSLKRFNNYKNWKTYKNYKNNTPSNKSIMSTTNKASLDYSFSSNQKYLNNSSILNPDSSKERSRKNLYEFKARNNHFLISRKKKENVGLKFNKTNKITVKSLDLFNLSLNSEKISEILNSTHKQINDFSQKLFNPCNLINHQNRSINHELLKQTIKYNKSFQNTNKLNLTQYISKYPEVAGIKFKNF